MATIKELSDLGQAVWLDYIRRSFVVGGELQGWINRGVRGVTSNPSILEKAVDSSSDYDQDLARFAKEGRSPEKIYEALVLEDIGRAADVLRPVHDATGDGYVSLEVSPALAYDTAGTVASAKDLFAKLGRPNVFIKVPGTKEGIPAIEELIAHAVNVNVTLLFSLAMYEASAEAYIKGLEKRLAEGKDISRVASVASFFVSRVDTMADKELEQRGNTELLGKLAIANAKVAYARFREIFRGPRWDKLASRARGCRGRCGRAPAPRTPSTRIRSTWTS